VVRNCVATKGVNKTTVQKGERTVITEQNKTVEDHRMGADGTKMTEVRIYVFF
jgi:hypothetical protein